MSKPKVREEAKVRAVVTMRAIRLEKKIHSVFQILERKLMNLLRKKMKRRKLLMLQVSSKTQEKCLMLAELPKLKMGLSLDTCINLR